MPTTLFKITPTPPTSIKVASGKEGKLSFTVESLAAPDEAYKVIVQAQLVGADGEGRKADWLLAGPHETLFMSGGEIETVTITARPRPETPPGEHELRLVVADKDHPNDIFAESPPVACEVLPAGAPLPKPKQPRPRWLIPAIVVGLFLGAASIAGAWKVCGNDGGQRVPSGTVPSGTIVAFGGTIAPDGWLLCDGAPISRTRYAALYAAIGDAWGDGDGSTTFNLPDLRGFFLRGADEKGVRDMDPKGRRSITGDQPASGVGSMQRQATAMPRNRFQISNSGEHHHQDPTTSGQPGPFELSSPKRYGHDYGAQSAPTGEAGIHSHLLEGGDEETRPINVAVNYMIKI